MNEYAEKLLENCNKEADMPEDVIEKYRNRVSDEIIDMWKTYGLCSTEDGYYKIVNPDDYADIINDLYYSEDNPIVIFATGMADLIVYDHGGYFFYVNIPHQKCGGVSRKFWITIRTMMESYFKESKLSWNPYEEAVKKYGLPKYNECFIYEPLLSLGGKESVDNLRKANLQVHLDIVSQMQDIITL